jgi:hypothetical protein
MSPVLKLVPKLCDCRLLHKPFFLLGENMIKNHISILFIIAAPCNFYHNLAKVYSQKFKA